MNVQIEATQYQVQMKEKQFSVNCKCFVIYMLHHLTLILRNLDLQMF